MIEVVLHRSVDGFCVLTQLWRWHWLQGGLWDAVCWYTPTTERFLGGALPCFWTWFCACSQWFCMFWEMAFVFQYRHGGGSGSGVGLGGVICCPVVRIVTGFRWCRCHGALNVVPHMFAVVLHSFVDGFHVSIQQWQ
jgi:hypothetical protein